jgi:hypothetical protein
MGRIARRALLLGGIFLCLVFACQSPTLPLPPPEEPEIDGPDEEGVAKLRGRVPQPRAWVFTINWTQLEADDPGAIGGDWADDEGVYEFEIRADVGDQCELWYEYAADKSQPRYFEISEVE